MNQVFANRRRTLRAGLASEKLDSLLVTHPADWYYLTGFTGDSGALVISRDHEPRAALITDGRFLSQAAEETGGVKIVKQAGALYPSVGKFLHEGRGRRVGFDASLLTVAQHGELLRGMGERPALRAAPGLVARLRMRKETSELAAMRRAALVADQVMALAASMLKPGVREFEVAAEIEYQMKKRGASGPAFETIVAFGPRAALPHARATAKRLRKNELVVLDLGAILRRYCSNVLARYKLDRYFVHSTGHGLGLEVHEDPRVAKGQSRLLEPGNVITIEPGVYLPEIGGIRIEDDVAVHANRSEVLTRVSRDFTEL